VAILVDECTSVVIQGITGREGSARARFMLDYGTRVVCGVTPGRRGSTVWGLPVYDTVGEAVEAHGPIDTSVAFVPAPQVKTAVFEAINAGVRLVLVPAERVPLHDSLEMIALARERGARIVGPGSMGILSAERAAVGWLGGSEENARAVFRPGPVGVASRSGGGTSTVVWNLKEAGLGITTAVHLGSEQVLGLSLPEVLLEFEQDTDTKAVALFCEIGTVAEEEAADIIKQGRFTKPVTAFVAGRALPSGMRFSHASAMVVRGRGSAQSKIRAFEEAGVHVVEHPHQMTEILLRALNGGIR
jgi:succinyl-CoA synthetase alpha subunit